MVNGSYSSLDCHPHSVDGGRVNSSFDFPGLGKELGHGSCG